MDTTVLEPDQRTADNRLVLVPVRAGRCGSVAVRTGRLPDGQRVGLAFSTSAALAAVFGADQAWISLNPAMARRMLAEAGAAEMRVDAVPFAPTAVAVAPKPLVALQTILPARRRAGARIRLAARHAQ
ncbi:hypothetical protein ABH926_007529 [Catenulispora sp. GP43]|uniref:SAV_915 family protein n=1 Tax=Catenulispora sp. GP43 TaxID=3156263 RepID=UPI003519D38F